MNFRIVTIILFLVLVILLITVYNTIENKAVFFLLIVGIVGINAYAIFKYKTRGAPTTFKEEKTELMLYGFLITIVVSLHFATEDKTNTTEIEQSKTEMIYNAEIENTEAEERKNAIAKIETTIINNYPFDVTVLLQHQKSKLDTIADMLNSYSDINVIIVGHTCEIGSKNINLRKGLKRAKAGKEYLIEKGINSERILVETKGEIQPLISNVSSENRKYNRRIEFVIE